MKIQILSLLVIALATCSGCGKESPPPTPTPSVTYPFFVDLQEGFTGTPVRVSVDRTLLFDAKPKTQPIKGIAGHFEGSATSKLITLRIEIPALQIDQEQQIDISETNGIGISVQNSKITIRQANGFGYD